AGVEHAFEIGVDDVEIEQELGRVESVERLADDGRHCAHPLELVVCAIVFAIAACGVARLGLLRRKRPFQYRHSPRRKTPWVQMSPREAVAGLKPPVKTASHQCS